MMRAIWALVAMIALGLSACATTNGGATAVEGKRRGLEPTETNDGGLRQAPPPPEDGESTNPESQPQAR